MVEGSCSLNARYRACKYLHKAIGTDDPTFANMMAGHAIALSFAGMIFIMFHLTENALVNNIAGSSISVISVALSVFMMLLEILVSYIQALVFTMLSAVFITFAHVKEHAA